MIPLERWLLSRTGGTQPAAPPIAMEQAVDCPPAELVSSVEGVAIPKVDNRLQELEQALATALCDHEELRQQGLKREQQLLDELGDDLSRHLSQAITDGLARLQSSIETAISQILMPFLRNDARAMALAELRTLISQTLSEATQPLIHVKAPGHLHAALRDHLAECGLATTVIEAESVELDFVDRRARFEELSSLWIERLEVDRA